MSKRKTLTGAGAASIAVMATLAGAPSVSAQEECISCDPQEPGQAAFFKIANLDFPGATLGVFHKDNVEQAPAFYKLSELKFPGATEGVFHKDNVARPSSFGKLSELTFPGVTFGVFHK